MMCLLTASQEVSVDFDNTKNPVHTILSVLQLSTTSTVWTNFTGVGH